MGIEPTSKAWEARNKNLKALELAALSSLEKALSWKISAETATFPQECTALHRQSIRNFLPSQIERNIVPPD